MFASETREKVAVVYFVALAAMMYYFMEQVITIPYTIPVRQIIVVLIIFSGFVCFLIRPNVARASVALKSALVFASPMLVMVTVSLPIWFVNRASTLELYREAWTYLIYMNQVLAALLAAVFLYMFGKKGIWYNLLGILIANVGWILSIMIENGVGTYMQELFRLITTFAGETGEIIGQAEVHELAFCLGIYLVYMILFWRKDLIFNCLLALATFCFVSAFKRIAMVSIAIALVLGFFLKFLQKKGKEKVVRRWTQVVWGVAILCLVLYIGFVRFGGFHLLEDLGIDTMSRADIYDQISDYYEFSPEYLGRGMGWTFYYLTRLSDLWENAIHNDHLQFYVDLGFWGYILWIISLTFVRTGYFGGKGRTLNRINTFTVMMYLLILSTTDNTMNYQTVYTVSAIIIMGHSFDEQVKETDEKVFGFVEEQNRILTDEDLSGQWRERRRKRKERKQEKERARKAAAREKWKRR